MQKLTKKANYLCLCRLFLNFPPLRAKKEILGGACSQTLLAYTHSE